jgi:hypothetical protein
MPDRMAQVREQLQSAGTRRRSIAILRPSPTTSTLCCGARSSRAVYTGWFAAAAQIDFTHGLSPGRFSSCFCRRRLLAFVGARGQRARCSGRLLGGRNRLYADYAPGFSAAGVPIHLWLRLSPACDPHRSGHGGDWLGKLAGPSAAFIAAAVLAYRAVASTQFLLALSAPALIFAGQPAGEDLRQ